MNAHSPKQHMYVPHVKSIVCMACIKRLISYVTPTQLHEKVTLDAKRNDKHPPTSSKKQRTNQEMLQLPSPPIHPLPPIPHPNPRPTPPPPRPRNLLPPPPHLPPLPPLLPSPLIPINLMPPPTLIQLIHIRRPHAQPLHARARFGALADAEAVDAGFVDFAGAEAGGEVRGRDAV